MNPILTQVMGMVGGKISQGAMNELQNALGVGAGALEGKLGATGIDGGQGAADFANRHNLVVDPNVQAQNAEQNARNSFSYMSGQDRGNNAYAAGIQSAFNTSELQKQMLAENQRNAANLAQAHLQNAAQRANTSASLIQGAMQNFARGGRY